MKLIGAVRQDHSHNKVTSGPNWLFAQYTSFVANGTFGFYRWVCE